MIRRVLVAVGVLGWLTVGPGVAAVAAQCSENAECGATQYCEKSTGDCDGVGACSERPSVCPDVWAPVCGCDGLTYGNNCLAAMAGINIASQGECPPPPCQDNDDCAQGELCLKTAGDCAGSGLCSERPPACPLIWDPVCGCDELSYANECLALNAGVNVAYEGECLTSCSSSDDCALLEYCDTAHNGCGGAGACRPRPDLCPEVYEPVCGCNELTIDNACLAAQQGTTVFAPGACGPCPFDASTDCVFSDALESGGVTRWSQTVGD